jgi:hypothetical protein
MVLERRRWAIPPGHQVLLRDVTWPEFELRLEECGLCDCWL